MGQTQDPEINIGGNLPPMHVALKRSSFSDLFTAVLIPRVRSVADMPEGSLRLSMSWLKKTETAF